MSETQTETTAKHRFQPHHVTFLLIGITSLAMLIRILALLWPYNVMTVNAPLKVLTKHPVSGGTLLYQLNYCKNPHFQNLYAEVQYSLIDSIIYEMPASFGPLQGGCHVIVLGISIPRVPGGHYQLVMRRIYEVNSVRKVVVSGYSDMFDIYDE